MKRVLAIIAAVAMIGVAFFFRSASGNGDSEPEVDVASTPTQPVDTSFEVDCIEEARKACSEAGVRSTAGFAKTFNDLTTEAEPSIDVWVVVEPWPAIIDAERAANGLEPIVGSTIVLGSTTFRSYGWAQLVSSSTCAVDGKVTVACLMADEPIGRKIGIRDPDESATGVLALAEWSAQLNGEGFSDQDLEELGLSAQTGSYESPLDAMALVGQGAFNLTVDLSSEAEGFLAGTRIEPQIADVLTLIPSVPVVLRIVEIGDGVPDDELSELASSLQPALQRFGWGAETGAAGPDANSVNNFRTLWEQIAR